jgi:hypothetical protein
LSVCAERRKGEDRFKAQFERERREPMGTVVGPLDSHPFGQNTKRSQPTKLPHTRDKKRTKRWGRRGGEKCEVIIMHFFHTEKSGKRTKIGIPYKVQLQKL